MDVVQVKTEPIDVEAAVDITEVNVEENPVKQEVFVPEIGFVEFATELLFPDDIDVEDRTIKLEPDLLDCLSPFPVHQNDMKPRVERKLLDCQVVVPKLLECELCGFYSNNKVELATHVEAHQPTKNSDWTHSSYKGCIPKNLKCIGCRVKYNHPDLWVWHLSNCHGPTPNIKVVRNGSNCKRDFQCVHCKIKYNCLRTMISHLRDDHNLEKLPYHCNKCHRQFVAWYSLRNHQSKCKKKVRNNTYRSIMKYNIKCNQCAVKFTQPEVSVWHSEFCHGKNALVKIVINHGNKKYAFQCIECEIVCKFQHLMVQHLRAQHQLTKLPFHCNACDKYFIYIYQLKYHQYLCKNVKVSETVIPKHNVNPTPKNLNCKTCNRSFKSQINLELHISNHHTRKFKCIHCMENQSSFSQLQSHCETRHAGKHYLECNVCKAEFFSHHGYVMHKLYKHEGTIFSCNICSAKFWSPSSLNTHIKSVHSKTQVSCKLCSATFKCATYLRKHVQRSHTGQILQCDHCGYSTRSKTHIIRHLRRRHF